MVVIVMDRIALSREYILIQDKKYKLYLYELIVIVMFYVSLNYLY